MKIGMVSLGCSKNQVDAERMLYKLVKAGYEIIEDPAMADVAIVNTCGFIESAKTEAIETIFELATLKKEGKIKKLLVTGCLSERYKHEAAELLYETDGVIGIGANEDIVDIIRRVENDERVCVFPDSCNLSLTGGRIQTTLPFYSYLKIADGCSNCCTYCSIPSIRGKYRSVPIEELISEAEQLAENGVKELIIIAQDTTKYGKDIYGEYKTSELLQSLCKIEGLKWIRLLYCYPETLSDELLEVIANEEKIVKYLDVPIQHCCVKILKNMNRVGDEQSLRELFAKIRTKIPDITLRTTLITGFPNESETDFETLCKFVDEMKFERLGCFAYSQEEGTAAADMNGQIDEDVKQRRAEIIMERQTQIMFEHNERLVGETVEVVTEGFDQYGGCYFGRTKADAPDIDGKIFFTPVMSDGSSPFTDGEEDNGGYFKTGEFVNVKVTDVLDYDLIGECVVN